MTTKQTRTRTPKSIPAMLPGAFATAIENRIAEFNNQLALEGRLTDDPAYVMLEGIRRELVNEGVATFERVVGVAPVETAPAPAPSKPRKTRQPRSDKGTSVPASTPENTAGARVCTEDEVLSLVADRTLTDEAPYGRDSQGLALAPYGVKNDGTPKKRRGRGEAPFMAELTGQAVSTPTETEEQTEVEAEASSDSEETEEVTNESDETETQVEAEASSDSEDDTEDLDEDGEDLTEDELDELLNEM